MKYLVALCILALVTLSSAATQGHSRGCIYVMERCYKECEVGTHAYTSGCGRLTPEPTCDQPNPQPEGGALCDYSACYCDAPTVRDTASNTCVTIDKCPQK